ncbi:hypothetical protein LLG07_08380 [bacterium]|nr:hypothetical protein [bacterium]
MKEKINKNNNKKSESTSDQKLQINNKPSDNANGSKPDIVDTYKEILDNHEQRKTRRGNVGAILVCIIIFLFVCFNIYLVEFEKHEMKMIKETQGKIADDLQAKLNKVKTEIAKKNKDSSNIISFNDQYLKIRQDFYLGIKEISEEVNNSKVNSLDDIKQLTSERIMLAKTYKSQMNSLNVPGVLNNFYKYEIEFLDSDIKLWNIVDSYYGLEDFSKFDLSKIDDENQKSRELYLKAQEELKSVYNKYELDYFLKDLLIK